MVHIASQSKLWIFLFLKVWKKSPNCFIYLFLSHSLQYMGSLFLNHEWNPPLHWKHSLNHWITREVPRWLFLITDHYQHLPPYFPSLLLHTLLISSSLVALSIESTWSTGDQVSISGLGRFPGEENGNPL